MARQRRRKGNIQHWIAGFESRIQAAAYLTFAGRCGLTTDELEAAIIELDAELDDWTKAAIRQAIRRERGMGADEARRLYDQETMGRRDDAETT